MATIIHVTVILGLMNSFSVLGKNTTVDFYFCGSEDDARFLFVGEENITLMCEANGFLNPTFKLIFNGDEFFDGNGVVSQNPSKIVVNLMESFLQVTISRLELSMNGKYTCVVTEDGRSNGVNSSLLLDVLESPQCRNNGSSVSMVRLDCIHMGGEEVSWSFNILRNNQSVTATVAMGLSNKTIGTNKVSTQLSQVNSAEIVSYKCSLKNEPMAYCIVENNNALSWEPPTISPSINKGVSFNSCSALLNRTYIPSTTLTYPLTNASFNGTDISSSAVVQSVTETVFSTLSGSSAIPNMNPMTAIIVSAFAVLLLCILLIALLCIFFKKRNHQKQKDRKEAVNHLFGGSVQINHHPSQYVFSQTIESSESNTSTYESVPYKTNQNEVNDEDERYASSVSKEMLQSYPVYDSAPTDGMPPHHLYHAGIDDKASSLDPMYDEAPSNNENLQMHTEKQQNINTTKDERSYEKSNYVDVDLGNVDEGVVYASVRKKPKQKKSKAPQITEITAMFNGAVTEEDVFTYSNTGMDDEDMTRL